jgi:hypothetical protein
MCGHNLFCESEHLAQVVTPLTCFSSLLLDSCMDGTSVMTWPVCTKFFSSHYSKITYHLLVCKVSDADSVTKHTINE